MKRKLFLRIIESISSYDPWFIPKIFFGKIGIIYILQKCTAAIRTFAYDLRADACDEYCTLNETIVCECLRRFVLAIWRCFESTYLRQPTWQDFES